MPTKTNRSGGPQTAVGRALTSQNAIKSGAYTTVHRVLPGESLADFDQLVQFLQADFCPHTVVEIALVNDIAVLLWKKWRIDKAAHALMVAQLNQPPSDADIKALLGSEDMPEGASLYAKTAITLTTLQADNLHRLAQQVAAFQKWPAASLPVATLQRDFNLLHAELIHHAQQRNLTVEQLMAQSISNSVFSMDTALQLVLIQIEIKCKCCLWVWQQRERIQVALAQANEARILSLMQDPQTSRATDDLNRALYRTLAELRKQQDWRLHTTVQDITATTSRMP